MVMTLKQVFVACYNLSLSLLWLYVLPSQVIWFMLFYRPWGMYQCNWCEQQAGGHA